MNAAEHARKAGELLAVLEAQEAELRDVTPERDLELAVSGGYSRLNADRRWTLELAIAHALTSLAYSGAPTSSCSWAPAA